MPTATARPAVSTSATRTTAQTCTRSGAGLAVGAEVRNVVRGDFEGLRGSFQVEDTTRGDVCKNRGVPEITPCLWFDNQAEEAAAFYASIFPNSRILSISRYGEAGREAHGQPPGRVMVVEFELDGKPFTGLNAGPAFTFNEI